MPRFSLSRCTTLLLPTAAAVALVACAADPTTTPTLALSAASLSRATAPIVLHAKLDPLTASASAWGGVQLKVNALP